MIFFRIKNQGHGQCPHLLWCHLKRFHSLSMHAKHKVSTSDKQTDSTETMYFRISFYSGDIKMSLNYNILQLKTKKDQSEHVG